jgi:hypothetical protein
MLPSSTRSDENGLHFVLNAFGESRERCWDDGGQVAERCPLDSKSDGMDANWLGYTSFEAGDMTCVR